jgi:membrane-bound serine protease (ClpP class)
MPPFRIPAFQIRDAAWNLGLAVAVSLVAALALARILPRTSAYDHLLLSRDLAAGKGFVSAPESDSLRGAVGIAITQLRPAGIGDFGGRRIDVVTRGDYVNAGAAIRVAEVHGSRIVVDAVSSGDGQASQQA